MFLTSGTVGWRADVASGALDAARESDVPYFLDRVRRVEFRGASVGSVYSRQAALV